MKNVIITGTSRGIGYELVKLFTDAGFNVLALSRNAAPISSMKLSGCTIFPFDITDSDDIESASKFVAENWKKVDILIILQMKNTPMVKMQLLLLCLILVLMLKMLLFLMKLH